LLLDLLAQFNGYNNGDLCAAWRLMKRRGWRSKDSLWKALGELRAENWLEVTRQGGKHVASLYALSFFAIDECGGKLDVRATGRPSGAWRKRPPLLPILRAQTESPATQAMSEPREVAIAYLPKEKLLPRLTGQSSENCPAMRTNPTAKAA
jgi:hypothetical protein